MKKIIITVFMLISLLTLRAAQGLVDEIYPFDLGDVTLAAGSRPYLMMMKNADYLLSLDNNRLLFSFRAFAGLDTKGALPYGGWEGKDFGFRGHFVGHYLSACALMYHNLKSSDRKLASRFLRRATDLVAELATCQQAIGYKKGGDYSGHPGYLNAQSTAQFDRLEALQTADVPYYVIHKIMAGLVDTYVYTGNHQALAIAEKMSGYFAWRMNRLSPGTISAMLNTRRYTGQYPGYFMEFGGMEDVLLKLYSLTENPADLKLAMTFERPWFTDNLVMDHDLLGVNGEHANTEIPCVIGMANHYAITHDIRERRGVLNFLKWMKDGHEFSTGGVSGKSAYPEPLDYGGELFNYPGKIDFQVNGSPGHPWHNCGESCCAHNLNKLTEYAFCWTGDAIWGQEYEKRFVNAVMAQQNLDNGMFLYNLNLKQGARKEWGTRDSSFWCCYGTGVEAYTSLAAGTYFSDHKNTLWINELLASTLNWKEKGLKLRQETSFPDDGYSKLTFSLSKNTRIKLMVRIPLWAKNGVWLKINGKVIAVNARPGSFAMLERDWKNGDILEVNFPFSLRCEPMVDQPKYMAVYYGPHVLVNCGPAGAVYQGSKDALIRDLKPTGKPCTFTTTLSTGKVTFKAICNVKDETYNGYTLISRPPAAYTSDRVIIGDSNSEAMHNIWASNLGRGVFKGKNWIDASFDGWISFNMKTVPSDRMYLKCKYWGSDSSQAAFTRLFDIQVYDSASENFISVATQYLDKQSPDQWYEVIYPLPLYLTAHRKTIRIRFRAKGFYGKVGKAGGLFDSIEMHYY